MIYVCDAIMGSGKTTAAFAFMREHSDRKFIFVTPYLSEVERAIDSCPDLKMVQPSAKLRAYHFKKSEHAAALIEAGQNIATTHQAFKGYTKDMLEGIRRQRYILVIDENVDVLDTMSYTHSDVDLIVEAGYLKREGKELVESGKPYTGTLYSEMFAMLRSRQLRLYSSGENLDSLYWTLPPELLTSFEDVYILTYLFEGQSLYYLCRLDKLPFEKIGVRKTEDGAKVFGKYNEYIPAYTADIASRIHILDNNRMNSVGDGEHALSATWFKNRSATDPQILALKRNLINFFLYIEKDSKSSTRLWSTYASGFSKLRGGGYSKSFLAFNTRATNKYKQTKYLAYCANVYVHLNEKMFFRTYNVDVNDDLYALSVMIQWIWRSAIREGQEVTLYLPSRRMRRLLTQWLDSFSEPKGGEACA